MKPSGENESNKEKLQEKFNSLQVVNRNITKSLALVNKANKDKDITINELSKKNEKIEENIKELLKEKESLIEDVKMLYEKLVEREKAFNSIVEKMRSIETENSNLLELVKNNEIQIQTLKENNAKAKSNPGTISSEQLEALNNIALEKETKLQNKIKELKIKNHKQNDQLKGLKSELDEKEESYKELEEANKCLESDYQLAGNQIEILQMKLEENEKEFAILKKRIGSFEKLTKDLETKVAQGKQTINKLTISCDAKEREKKLKESNAKISIENMENRLILIKSQLEKTEMLLTAKDEEIKVLKNAPDCKIYIIYS